MIQQDFFTKWARVCCEFLMSNVVSVGREAGVRGGGGGLPVGGRQGVREEYRFRCPNPFLIRKHHMLLPCSCLKASGLKPVTEWPFWVLWLHRNWSLCTLFTLIPFGFCVFLSFPLFSNRSPITSFMAFLSLNLAHSLILSLASLFIAPPVTCMLLVSQSQSTYILTYKHAFILVGNRC